MSEYDPEFVQQSPPIAGFDTPSPKRHGVDRTLGILAVLLAFILIGLGVVLFVVLRQNAGHIADPGTMVQAPAPQTHSVVTIERSTGGVEYRKGTAEGGSIKLSADQIKGDELKVAPTAMSFGDLGAITGGAFSGNISASTSGLLWVRILGGAWALLCFWRAYVKWQLTPADIPHIAGTAAAGIPGVVAVIAPEFALACALGAAVIFIAPHLMPSRSDKAGKTMRTLRKVTRAIENAPGELGTQIKTEIGKHSVDDTIIEAAKKAEGV